MQMLTKGHFTSVLVIDLDLLSFDLKSIAFFLPLVHGKQNFGSFMSSITINRWMNGHQKKLPYVADLLTKYMCIKVQIKYNEHVKTVHCNKKNHILIYYRQRCTCTTPARIKDLNNTMEQINDYNTIFHSV